MRTDLQIEKWPVDRLLPYIRNARTHSDAQVAQIAACIVEFGWTNPILVSADGVIIAGHARLAAARKLGLDEVPVIVLDHLSETQRRALVLADNRLALSAGWDEEMLRVELESLEEEGFDLDLVGFSDEELEQLGPVQRGAAPVAPTKTLSAGTLALLVSRPILLCFGYFVLLSISLTGNQTFLPAALNQLYGIPLATAGAALSAYLLASSMGVLLGGIAADHTARHEGIVAAGLLAAAAIMLLVGYVRLPDPAVIAALALAGFASGTTTPSRDMLVRAATPVGATGKVFGFVYSGLDLGAAVTPPVLGMFLDRGEPRAVFILSAAALALTIGTALRVGKIRASRVPRAEPAAAE